MKINRKNKKDSFNWYILLVITLTSVVAGIYRDGFAALFPFLQIDFGLTRTQLGMVFTLFYSTSAIVSIYTGRLVDIKGTKWGLIYSSVFMGILYLLHSIAPTFIAILLIAALTGLIVSLNLPTISKSVTEWFPYKYRSIALGIQSMGFPIGGLIGAIILPSLGNLFGWRKAIVFPGLIALSYAFFVSHAYKEKKDVINNDKKSKRYDNNRSFWKSFHQLIVNRELLIISLFGFFLGSTSSVIIAHFTLFLFLDYNLSKTIAGLGFAIVQFGSIFGRAIWGFVCDRILMTNKRITFFYMGLFFSSLAIASSLFLQTFNPPIFILFIFAFLIGFSGNGWLGLYNAAIIETVPEENIGIAIGFTALFLRSGMMLSPPVFGYIADLNGTYNLSWFLIGILLLLASTSQYLFSKKKNI
jgi:sugar phosphate permease